VTRYEIRLPYALSPILQDAFPEMEAVQIAPDETLLNGELRDQSELHSLIARLGDLGLDIAEVRQIASRTARPTR
jgi:hypothetical protein